MRRTLELVSVAIFSIAAALATAPLFVSIASAFPNQHFIHMPASGRAGVNRAGAGGIYGTGGRTDFGVKCSHCHVRPTMPGFGSIDFTMTASPAFASMLGDLTYVPGQRYTITIRLTGEHRRGTRPLDNVNGFSASFENASGRVVGRLISDSGQDSTSCPATDPFPTMPPPTGTTVMWGDCHGMYFLERPNTTSWTFDWVAPAAGTGDVSVFVGVVDGDHAGESSLDDDTVERVIPLLEGG